MDWSFTLSRTTPVMLAPNSFGHPMLSLVIINLLAGALLGVRFTVVIVIPAAFAALVEAILLESGAGSWNSLVWQVPSREWLELKVA